MAPSLIAGGDAFVAGVQLVIEAALQSPNFLYRTELSSEVGSGGYIDLNDHEIAARLSYALWNSMPDDTLDGLADAGELHTPEQVAAQAQRMLEDERAEATVADFHGSGSTSRVTKTCCATRTSSRSSSPSSPTR